MKSKIGVLVTAIMVTGLIGQASAGDVFSKTVDCTKGDKINQSLQASNAKILDLVIKGTCQEFVVIERDDVTLRGLNQDSTLIGLIDIRAASRVIIRDFLIHGDEDTPVSTDFGGINALNGSSVTIANMRVEDINTRGVQVMNAAAVIRDTTVTGAVAGNFVFRSSRLTFQGSLVGNNGFVGMSLVNSTATAKGANLSFSGNRFGLLVQINSGLEHISGNLTVNDNQFGLLVLGQGFFAAGSFMDIRNNRFYGVFVDELSSFTPLIGAPGGGPTLAVTGNPGFGVSVERGSTLEIFPSATITGNGVGLNVDASLLVAAAAKVHGNSGGDVLLHFGTRATFNGNSHEIGSPVQCGEAVIVRGTVQCGAPLSGVSSLNSATLLPDLSEELAELRN